MRRRKAREVALQILFSADGKESPSASKLVEAYFANFAPTNLKEICDVPYLEKLLDGVFNNRQRLDAEITKQSENWKLTRMPPVDRNILRLGAQEIMFPHDEVPPKVAIDESLELAKKYGTEESSAFVNGILDKLQPEKKNG